MGEGVKKMTGFPPQAFLEDPTLWPSRIHPDDARAVIDEFDCLLRERTPMRSRYRWRHANGRYGYYLSEAYITEARDGRDVVACVWTYGGPVDDQDDERPSSSLSHRVVAFLPICHELLDAASGALNLV